MFDIKTLNRAIEQLASEKDLDVAQVLEAVEAALASAYKKEYEKKGEVIRCTLDSKKGELRFFQVKTVVDEATVRFEEPEVEGEKKPKEVEYSSAKASEDNNDETLLPFYNPERHLLLDEAKKIKKDVIVGEEMFFDLESPSSDFGRIAAQTAKGRTDISRVYHLDRGYDKIEQKLSQLGADIHREKEE